MNEKKMKLSNKSIALIFLVITLIATFCVFQFVYTPNVNKYKTQEKQYEELLKKEKDLKELQENKQKFLDEINVYEAENTHIISKYPVEVLPENLIMYTVELQKNPRVHGDIFFPTVSYSLPSEFKTGFEEETQIYPYQQTMSASFEGTYDGVKRAILYNYEDNNNRMVIDNISMAYDSSTGGLSGSMMFSIYTLQGTDSQYKEPYIEKNIRIGKPKGIFGTFDEIVKK